MEKKIIQISITDIRLDHRGPLDGAEDVNLLRFSLSYPAEGVPNIETVKTIRANKPLPTDWSSDFDKSIVFKTPIRGQAKLTIEIVSVDKESDAEKFFGSLFKSIFGSVMGIWAGDFVSVYVGAITKSVGTSLLDLIEHDDDVDVIGKASMILDSESLSDKIELDLEVEQEVVRKEYVNAAGGPPSRRRRRVVDTVVIPAGNNGHISLKVLVL